MTPRHLPLALLLAASMLLAPHLAFAACTTPTGTAGDVIFNNTFNRMQYCDGTNWVNMGTGALGTLTAGDACTTDGSVINCTTALGTMATQNASSVAITGGTITGLPTPTVSSDAATKAYVDAATSPFCNPANVQTFTASGTWTKPSCGLQTVIECWGGGGGGVAASSAGGGGGAYNTRTLATARLASTVTVTVGAGQRYTSGGATTFGTWLTANGGSVSGDGGGAGPFLVGNTTYDGGAVGTTGNGKNSFYGGGGGGGNSGGNFSGGNSIYGGAGGGTSSGCCSGGGASVYGGNGASYNGSTTATPPGGGGNYNSSGAAGQCIVTTY